MKWQRTLQKGNGKSRRQFSSWHVPKDVLEAYNLRDKDMCLCSISLITGELLHSARYRLTSGGEFRLGKAVADTLKSMAEADPASEIVFDVAPDWKQIADKFEQDVEDSLKSSDAERQARLSQAPVLPRKILTFTESFLRNPDVAAEVISRANGRCEDCGQDAPFFRASNGTPYLEAHHRVRLADGGEDTVANATAICPNCHRRAHYGAASQ
jgi:hypothetical protein